MSNFIVIIHCSCRWFSVIRGENIFMQSGDQIPTQFVFVCLWVGGWGPVLNHVYKPMKKIPIFCRRYYQMSASETVWILNKMSLKYVIGVLDDALVDAKPWHLTRDKPLPQPMLIKMSPAPQELTYWGLKITYSSALHKSYTQGIAVYCPFG